MKLNFSKPVIIAIVSIAIMLSAGTAYAGVVLPTITLGGNVDVIGDMEFTSDNTSITFPATSLPNQPMIEMFESGASNDDRMVIAHSPGFPNYGMEYRDNGDEFVFKSTSTDRMIIDLSDGTVDIPGKLTVGGGVDPPYVSFTSENHDTIREMAQDVEEKEEVMVFWNTEKKQMEVFIIAEDTFYTFDGTIVE